MNKLYLSKKLRANAVLLIVSSTFLFYAYSTGITGVTIKNGDGCICHASTPSSNVTVNINGPDTLAYNQTALYTVTITGGPLVRGGTNIASSSGVLTTTGTDLQVIGDELTHTSPKEPSSGVVTFSFNYTAPSVTGAQTIYANGNSVNFNGTNTGDEWNFASNKTIAVVPVVPVELSSFTAEVIRSDVYLNWTTATEKNNSGFEVLRFENAVWIKAGFIKGSGSTSEIHNYNFIDKKLAPGVYSYKLRQVDFDGTSNYYTLGSEVVVNSPAEFVLYQNYPNPFNPSTVIEFELNSDANVTLKVYNLAGEEIAVLINENLPAGSHKRIFDTRSINNISSGIYFYELTAGSKKTVRKMVFNK